MKNKGKVLRVLVVSLIITSIGFIVATILNWQKIIDFFANPRENGFPSIITITFLGVYFEAVGIYFLREKKKDDTND